ncbi:unnamed protein product [Allacma fusca]|uniref:Uncharacterized protein n=1 Tax=Allacma fusca TaxID=39272 RepID=A0A8J2JY94_9HEXA|nr:unnamed protein product [Allacma fusca]
MFTPGVTAEIVPTYFNQICTEGGPSRVSEKPLKSSRSADPFDLVGSKRDSSARDIAASADMHHCSSTSGLVGLRFLAYGKSLTSITRGMEPNISPVRSGSVQSTPPGTLMNERETKEHRGLTPTPSDVDTFSPAGDDSSSSGSSVALADLITMLTQPMVSPLVKTDFPRRI